MMAFMGVRISWLILARNWLLLVMACCALSRASLSDASCCLRSVTSRKQNTRPMVLSRLRAGWEKHSITRPSLRYSISNVSPAGAAKNSTTWWSVVGWPYSSVCSKWSIQATMPWSSRSINRCCGKDQNSEKRRFMFKMAQSVLVRRMQSSVASRVAAKCRPMSESTISGRWGPRAGRTRNE